MKSNNARKIGKLGLEVTPVGIGAMSFTNFYGPCDDDQANNVLKTAIDLGLNHIDTSNVYGMGTSEERIGSFLKKQGKQANNLFSIATKAAIYRNPDTGSRGVDNSFTHLEDELDKSLERMNIDCVDLFYVHRRDSNIPIEEVKESLTFPANPNSWSRMEPIT